MRAASGDASKPGRPARRSVRAPRPCSGRPGSARRDRPRSAALEQAWTASPMSIALIRGSTSSTAAAAGERARGRAPARRSSGSAALVQRDRREREPPRDVRRGTGSGGGAAGRRTGSRGALGQALAEQGQLLDRLRRRRRHRRLVAASSSGRRRRRTCTRTRVPLLEPARSAAPAPAGDALAGRSRGPRRSSRAATCPCCRRPGARDQQPVGGPGHGHVETRRCSSQLASFSACSTSR